MKTLGALIVAHNEEQFIRQCIELIAPYCDEIIVIDHESTDKTVEEAYKASPKVQVHSYPYQEPVDMGAVRTFALSKATTHWIWQVDTDEYYPKESCELIKNAIQDTQALSFRVPYHNLSWRHGFEQVLEHYPDRLYRRDVVDCWKGVLPMDMTFVKEPFIQAKTKVGGLVGVLEYDNYDDKSFENPVQPIIQAPFYHLARTRGYNYEFDKWRRYNINVHPEQDMPNIEHTTRLNQWVSGLYDMRPVEVPDYIPTSNIKDPKVSVIIPNFQYAKYVGEAIESCLNQTVKPFEIIVVDDGSHDNSVEVIKQYEDKGIILFEKPNGGVASARNQGIHFSKGDYYVCLDADDKLAPTYIEETLKEMKDGVQIVYTDLEFFDQQQGIHNYPEFSTKALKEWQIIPSACALVDRRAFNLCGGFDLNKWYEDWAFWLRMDSLGIKFKHIAKPLMQYRKHGYSRINMLDENQKYGFDQLKKEFNITRNPDPK